MDGSRKNGLADLRDRLLDLRRLRMANALPEDEYRQRRAALAEELAERVSAAAPARPQWLHTALAAAALACAAAAAGWWLGARGSAAGAPPASAQVLPEAPPPASPGQVADRGKLATMTAALQHRLEREPGNAEGWALLGRSHALLEQPREAAAAFEKALALRPREATWTAEYAAALAAADGRLGGRPEAALKQALAIEPDNLKALWLAGALAFEQQDWRGALHHWQRMLQVGPIEDIDVLQLQAGMAEARRRQSEREALLPANAAAR